MTPDISADGRAPRPSFVELFTPKLVTILREGYGLAHFRADAHRRASRWRSWRCPCRWRSPSLPAPRRRRASTPRSSAASWSPRSAAAGSRSAARPARSSCWSPPPCRRTAWTGCILATILSGLMLAAMGFLRLGTYIKFIPYPVTVGFTAGIAVIIFASQLKRAAGARARRAGARPAAGEAARALAQPCPRFDAATRRALDRHDRHHRRR